MTALTELREAEAPPAIAALYQAIREASGVPLVNLIYRHLATMPGVLDWVWAAIRAPLQDGRLAGARLRLAAALPLPPITPLTSAEWAAGGLPEGARAAVVALAEVYTRGNLTNLILLTALRRALENAPPELGPPPVPQPGLAMLPMPPPLPKLDALPPVTRDAVLALAARHGAARGETTVVPSLYLHCAHWPALPGLLPGWLGAVLSPEAIAAGRDAAVRLAVREADALRPALAESVLASPVPGGQVAGLRAVLGTFTGEVIPAMVPVGLALARRLAV